MIQTVGRAALADRLRLLIVSNFGRSSCTLSTITKYVRIGNSLGHTVALFSDPITDMPDAPTSRNTSEFDYLMFVIYEAADFPRLPYLAHLLDTVPLERQIVVDCAARYNETIRVEDDLNHPERIDRESGWEWVGGLSALAKTILQPTMSPLRSQAQAFLFHGFEPKSVQRPYSTAAEAADAWAGKGSNPTKYGIGLCAAMSPAALSMPTMRLTLGQRDCNQPNTGWIMSSGPSTCGPDALFLEKD